MPYKDREKQSQYLREYYVGKQLRLNPGWHPRQSKPPRVRKNMLHGRPLTHTERASRANAKRYGYLPVDPKTVRPKPQDGLCEYCRKRPGICMDHDHETGKFRAWLCWSCNTGFGRFGDTVEGLRRALEFLIRVS